MQRHNNDRKMNTGRPWVNLFSRILSHAAIILACVLTVLLACDMFLKGEMSFLANTYSKMMIFILCMVTAVNSIIQLSCLDKLRSLRRYMRLKKRSGK